MVTSENCVLRPTQSELLSVSAAAGVALCGPGTKIRHMGVFRYAGSWHVLGGLQCG